MKIEIGEQKPSHLKEYWPEQHRFVVDGQGGRVREESRDCPTGTRAKRRDGTFGNRVMLQGRFLKCEWQDGNYRLPQEDYLLRGMGFSRNSDKQQS